MVSAKAGVAASKTSDAALEKAIFLNTLTSLALSLRSNHSVLSKYSEQWHSNKTRSAEPFLLIFINK
jgi:hypothetical protein